MVLIKAIIQEEKRIKGITCVNITFVHYTYISFLSTCKNLLKYGEFLGLVHGNTHKTKSHIVSLCITNKYNTVYALLLNFT